MRIFSKMSALACAGVMSSMAHAGAVDVTVTIENLAPQFGTYQTPFWVGFHDGGFDLYDLGAPASASLEALAEDGATGPLSGLFGSSGFGSVDGTVAPGGPFAPGEIASMTFSLDGSDAASRYFSYASMVIPSNDAFVANGNPMAHEIFDAKGNFVGTDFFITGFDVLDAGTEVNNEVPEFTAFFGQMTPDTGPDEGGVVHAHPGFLGSAANPGMASILADSMFSGADFTINGYPIARITVTPAPGAFALLGIAGLATGRRRRRI